MKEEYDLIVVGGGISGLAAAYLYQQKHGTDKKILILDNHDDFGGHAKRNEHTVNGTTLISYGGSQSIVEPKHASRVVHNLLKDIGVDIERFDRANKQNADEGQLPNILGATQIDNSPLLQGPQRRSNGVSQIG